MAVVVVVVVDNNDCDKYAAGHACYTSLSAYCTYSRMSRQPPADMIRFWPCIEYIFGHLLDWEFNYDETHPDRLYSTRSFLHEIIRICRGEQRTWL